MPRAVPIITGFTSGELSPRLEGRIDFGKYASGCRQLENAVVHPHGGAVRRSGLRFVAEVRDSSRRVRLIPFVFSVTQAYVLEFGHFYLRIYMDGGQVLDSGVPYEITTPYPESDLPGLKYCQSADVLYLAHRNHPPMKLARMGHTDWSLSEVNFGPPLPPPAQTAALLTGTGAGEVHEYVVTALTDDLFESEPSGLCSTDGPARLGDDVYVTVSWQAVTGASEYAVYKGTNGVYGRIGRAVGTSFVDRGEIRPDDGTTPPARKSPFDGPGNYPAAVAFYQQRLCWAGTGREPMAVWLSQTGDFQNLNRASPARDDDACKFVLNADQVNDIRWLASSRCLLVGTAGGEWYMAGAGGAPIGPASVDARPAARYGSADLMPVMAGDVVLFLDRTGRVVREFSYSFEQDGYRSVDLSILAEHLTREHRIVGWACQQSPGCVVWCVRDDGVLLGLTCQREHQVAAWHRHVTDGAVEAVCTVPAENRDDVWVCVRRTIGGQDRRYVERLEAGFEADTAVDAFFVDSGLTYRGEPAMVISGLDHLEGREVDILADGAVLPRQAVSGGRVVLEAPAAVVHAGLPYVTTIEPMRLEAGAADGASQGRIKRISEVTLRLYKSLGVKAGPLETMLDIVPFRTTADPMGRPPGLFTGDRTVTWPGRYDTDARMIIRQDQPLPLTVLAVIPRVETSGR